MNIEVGDVVKKRACRTTGPEAFVTVIEKKPLWYCNEGRNFYGYTVLQPDGTIAQYTDATLETYIDGPIAKSDRCST